MNSDSNLLDCTFAFTNQHADFNQWMNWIYWWPSPMDAENVSPRNSLRKWNENLNIWKILSSSHVSLVCSNKIFANCSMSFFFLIFIAFDRFNIVTLIWIEKYLNGIDVNVSHSIEKFNSLDFGSLARTLVDREMLSR